LNKEFRCYLRLPNRKKTLPKVVDFVAVPRMRSEMFQSCKFWRVKFGFSEHFRVSRVTN